MNAGKSGQIVVNPASPRAAASSFKQPVGAHYDRALQLADNSPRFAEIWIPSLAPARPLAYQLPHADRRLAHVLGTPARSPSSSPRRDRRRPVPSPRGPAAPSA